MTYYDYKVVPAPTRAKRVRGVKAAPELVALAMAEAINEVARQGWEYVRAENVAAEAPGGWLRRGAATEVAVLVFRRPREHLSPRLAAERDHVETEPDARVVAVGPAAHRGGVRHERFPQQPATQPAEAAEAPPIAWRPGPRLGPAEKP